MLKICFLFINFYIRVQIFFNIMFIKKSFFFKDIIKFLISDNFPIFLQPQI